MSSDCIIALKPVIHLQRVNGSFVKLTWVLDLWLQNTRLSVVGIGRMPEPLRSCLSERGEESILLADTNTTAQQCIQAQGFGWFITNEYFPSLLRLHITSGATEPVLVCPTWNIHTFFVDNFLIGCKEKCRMDLNIVNSVKRRAVQSNWQLKGLLPNHKGWQY